MLQILKDTIDQLQPDIYLEKDVKLFPQNAYFPTLSDLVIPSISLAVIFIILRYLLDIYVVAPFGACFGINENSKTRVKPNPILEMEYRKCKHPSSNIVLILSKKTQLTEREVQIWFRDRKKQDKASDLKRLQDASWQLIFYFILSWYGIYILWDKPWFTQSEYIWQGWPSKQPVSYDVYWYYVVELAFYISSVVTLFTDHVRKDFTELAIHHIVTIALLSISWNYNCIRIGTLVLCVHDPVDYFLAFAKIASYCKYHNLAEIGFILFVVVWIGTRLTIYPIKVVYAAVFGLSSYAVQSDDEHVKYYERTWAILLLQTMLCVLQVLHIFWTILIVKTAATKFTRKEMQDARSDTEDSECEDDNKNSPTKHMEKNGTFESKHN